MHQFLVSAYVSVQIPVVVLKICSWSSAGWLFLDSSTSMFMNARGRVYRIPESKKKLKVGAEADKAKSSSASGERLLTNNVWCCGHMNPEYVKDFKGKEEFCFFFQRSRGSWCWRRAPSGRRWVRCCRRLTKRTKVLSMNRVSESEKKCHLIITIDCCKVAVDKWYKYCNEILFNYWQ